ncbi:hypothetical protein [Anaeroselena agilis]|uniref:Uncharacterized protein n=1 Tax=Anaeroselena agilis TaxID=3063788 RepID=A0ABU3P2N3_9FIRM|nr:hypothetical protein [Selenomonadales bacterium 4137-cl]
MINELGPGKVALDYGPTQMVIQISGAGATTRLAREAAVYAVRQIGELAEVRLIAARPQQELGDIAGLPEVLQRMAAAVRMSGDEDLTPLAAVAGAIADMTADWLFAQGIPRCIVNNGGDIAVRLADNERVTVGVAPGLGRQPAHVLRPNAGDGIGGITTSGSGGRSFSQGIATAATVAASCAALADACSTSIGNAVYAPHPAIRLVRAEEIDPATDIPGRLVVRDIGELPPEIIQAALGNGRRRAKQYYDKGIIRGCAIFIGDIAVTVPEEFLYPLKNNK